MDEEPSQWNLPGSLLYSVTIITTIGAKRFININIINFMLDQNIFTSGYGHIAPKTMWGQIATMVYAVFGLPIFMLWLSNVGTLLAQTFTFLYANICCFVCRRGKRNKGARRK